MSSDSACIAPPSRLRMIQSILNRVTHGSIDVQLPSGEKLRAIGNSPGPSGKVEIKQPQFFGRLMTEGDLGFGEMYMEGWWSTPDLQDVLDVVLLNNENMARRFTGAGLFRLKERLRHLFNRNSKTGSRRNIQHHYDLGNDFYRLWLDKTMTYSSALFRSRQESLVDAQTNKYAAICDRLACAAGDHILEIGCGWGGFAEFAARERGVKVTGLTISKEQHDYAKRRLFEAGLADRTEILMRDYRDEQGTYDGIASIEMIEAVGEKYWPLFFSTLRNRLRPNCSAAIQAIVIADRLFPRYRKGADFIQKHIFPGGMLLSPKSMARQAKAVNLSITGCNSLADSYSRTLRDWRRRFNERWEEISTLGFDDRFHRMWNFYLAASAAGFAAGTTDVVQVGLLRAA